MIDELPRISPRHGLPYALNFAPAGARKTLAWIRQLSTALGERSWIEAPQVATIKRARWAI